MAGRMTNPPMPFKAPGVCPDGRLAEAR
jgi:hypothetical protein